MKRNNRHDKHKQEITLMTLLANEATKESANVLSKHNIPKAKGYADLEVKLAELYFNSDTDRVELEKELAEIHPHKKWIMKTLELVPKSEIKTSSKEKDLDNETKEVKSKESCYHEKCNDDNCIIHGRNSQVFSNFTGTGPQTSSTSNDSSKTMESIAIIGTIGLVGLMMIIVSKNMK